MRRPRRERQPVVRGVRRTAPATRPPPVGRPSRPPPRERVRAARSDMLGMRRPARRDDAGMPPVHRPAPKTRPPPPGGMPNPKHPASCPSPSATIAPTAEAVRSDATRRRHAAPIAPGDAPRPSTASSNPAAPTAHPARQGAPAGDRMRARPAPPHADDDVAPRRYGEAGRSSHTTIRPHAPRVGATFGSRVRGPKGPPPGCGPAPRRVFRTLPWAYVRRLASACFLRCHGWGRLDTARCRRLPDPRRVALRLPGAWLGLAPTSLEVNVVGSVDRARYERVVSEKLSPAVFPHWAKTGRNVGFSRLVAWMTGRG